MTDEVYTFLSLFKSHLFDSVVAERRPHMLFLCIRTVCVYNRNLEKVDGIGVMTTAQVLPFSVGQKYSDTRRAPLCTNSSTGRKATGWTKTESGFGQDLARKRQLKIYKGVLEPSC